jgi:SAM-dependent methyltransferase
MASKSLKRLEMDKEESVGLINKLIIDAKLFCYGIQRPLVHPILKSYLQRRIPMFDHLAGTADLFLLNEGGIFKRYVYQICNKFYPLKGLSILIPGAGFGRNLYQLAVFKPKRIVAFDLFEYPTEWEFIKWEIMKQFGVEVIFYKGDFNTLLSNYSDPFDFIISDAVLEHVNNIKEFMASSKMFLKDNGIFYASFGPVWYGPSGDHLAWGKERLFDHLVLSKDEYQKNFRERFTYAKDDSTEAGFMVENNLFSYSTIENYFTALANAGFEKSLVWFKISTEAIFLLKRNQLLRRLLDERHISDFDRICSGIYLWAKNNR